mmetsp:Transcript_53461/g.124515  ORF Transcript_53461/g.124515 Transcript_53461/m.124515 type:complete len:234 (-) Transcript_53461:50-751(-)
MLEASTNLALHGFAALLPEVVHGGGDAPALSPQQVREVLELFLPAGIGRFLRSLRRGLGGAHGSDGSAKSFFPGLLEELQPLLEGSQEVSHALLERLLHLLAEVRKLLSQDGLGGFRAAPRRNAADSALHSDVLQLLVDEAPLKVTQLPDSSAQVVQGPIPKVSDNHRAGLDSLGQALSILQGRALGAAEAEGRAHLKLLGDGVRQRLLQRQRRLGRRRQLDFLPASQQLHNH